MHYIRFVLVAAVLAGFGSSYSAAQQASSNNKWQPDWDNLGRHHAPEWILDAKIGIQFVGAPGDFDDRQCFHWTRSAQRYRQFGSNGPDAHVQTMLSGFKVVGGLPYVWVHEPEPDPGAVIEKYKQTGARFLVSMLWGAYPGTEGLWMTPEEIRAARKQGLKVGIHYNLLRRDGIPSMGDAGYVEWYQRRLEKGIRDAGADFVFFDGCQASSDYLKTAEFLAWYYNWAKRNGKQVWVNDDLGNDRNESGEYGDLTDHEGFTVSGISAKPWIDWDMPRNEWNCWVNEFGINKRDGQKWVWEYKPADELLHVFLDTVSKGGGWIIQMVNTEKAWNNMREIGAWLKVNGEAIYGTRPYGAPVENVVRLPKGRPPDRSRPWWSRFKEVVKIAEADGPLYFTRQGHTVYAIHWGWPGETVVIPNVTPAEDAKIRMLGVAKDLEWQQSGSDVVIHTPAAKPCNYAYAFRIPLAR